MKKFISMFLAVIMIMSLGTCAFAAGDPNHGLLPAVAENATLGENASDGKININNGTVKTNNGTIEYNYPTGTVETNNGTIDTVSTGGNVETNNGTVKTNWGTVDANTSTGTVTTNNGTVDVNNGKVTTNTARGTVTENYHIVTTNDGTVTTNGANGTVATNNGTVEENATGGTVNNNFDTIGENNGTVKTNDGTVTTNNGTVTKNSGIVQENFGVVTNAESGTVTINFATVNNASINESESTIRYGNDTVYGVTYADGDKKTWEKCFNYSAEKGTVITVATTDEVINFAREIYGINIEDVSLEVAEGKYKGTYNGGETFTLEEAVWFIVNFKEIIQSAKNYETFSADSNGKAKGSSFFFAKSLEQFQNVSFNGTYLEKDKDYTVEEVEGGIMITFTDSFFEAHPGAQTVAPLFIGSICMLTAVKE